MVLNKRSSLAVGVITRKNDQRQPLRGAAFCARFSGHARTTGGVINRQHLSRAVFMVYLIEGGYYVAPANNLPHDFPVHPTAIEVKELVASLLMETT